MRSGLSSLIESASLRSRLRLIVMSFSKLMLMFCLRSCVRFVQRDVICIMCRRAVRVLAILCPI